MFRRRHVHSSECCHYVEQKYYLTWFGGTGAKHFVFSIGHRGPLLQRTSSSVRKATTANQIHSNDLAVCWTKCCYIWFHYEVKFLTHFWRLFGFTKSFWSFYSISIEFYSVKSLFCKGLLLQTGRLQQQTKYIAMISQYVGRSFVILYSIPKSNFWRALTSFYTY